MPGRSGATLRRPLAARDASAARTLPTISSLPVRTGWTSRPEADQAARKVAVVPHGHDVSVLRSAGSRASCVQHQGARPGTAPTDLVHRRPGRLARRQRRPRRPQPHPTDISAWLRILVGTCQASASITWLISEPAALRRLLQAEHWGRWRRRCPGRAPEQVPGRTWAKRIQWRAEGQRSRTRVTPRPGTAARHRSLFCGAGVREGRGQGRALGWERRTPPGCAGSRHVRGRTVGRR